MAVARQREPATLELVLKRNPVERLKREKSPLGILDELPALIAAGYEQVAEEDLVRLKWWGLYHDKPKIGTFMLRIKLPGGRATPEQLRTIGRVSNRFGRGEGELSTRQNVQLHYLELGSLPETLAELKRAGLTTAGACGDAVRNVTGCPLAGVAHDELFDAAPVVDEVARFFYGHPEYSDLPRKHKISIAACAHRCSAPEINCISLVGVIHEGLPGFAVLVGGGLSSVPRLARGLGVLVRPDEALPVLRALLDAWKEDLTYRVSRVKARMKFMVDDYGPEGMRAEVERRLGYSLTDYELPPPGPIAEHLGGEPHCNFSVAETKTRLDAVIQHLESRFGNAIAGLRMHLDGCPHACAQHWVGDLGFQGTTSRDAEGKRRQAYDIFLRGGLGPDAAIARPVFRRVPAEELALAVEGLVGGWLESRRPGEAFRAFTDRLSNDELGVLAGLEPAKAKEKEAA